jgi:hypothetical protein
MGMEGRRRALGFLILMIILRIMAFKYFNRILPSTQYTDILQLCFE